MKRLRWSENTTLLLCALVAAASFLLRARYGTP